MAIENTWPFGCGFQGKSLPVATSIAAAFWRVRVAAEPADAPVGRTLVKTPPMYMTPPEMVIARTLPLVCQVVAGGSWANAGAATTSAALSTTTAVSKRDPQPIRAAYPRSRRSQTRALTPAADRAPTRYRIRVRHEPTRQRGAERA